MTKKEYIRKIIESKRKVATYGNFTNEIQYSYIELKDKRRFHEEFSPLIRGLFTNKEWDEMFGPTIFEIKRGDKIWRESNATF